MNKFNERGQILIFVTLGMVLMGLLAGLGIDLGRGYLMNTRLQRVVDGASLAAAKALKGQAALEGLAIQAAQDAAEMNGYTCCSGTDNLSVTFVDQAVPGGPPMKFVQITGSSSIPTTLMRLLSLITGGTFSTLQVSAFAEAGPERPVDLMLVLDRSGSMSRPDGTGTLKINALKTAVNEFLDSTFSPDDKVGIVSFASRGCGTAGSDFTGNNCLPDEPLGTPISDLKTAVNILSASGGTNTMEALRTGGDTINAAFGDLTRSTTRKAILLVTDGQPTFMRRWNNTGNANDNDCHKNPRTGANLPSPGNSGSFSNGCIFGGLNWTNSSFWSTTSQKPGMLRTSLSSPSNSACSNRIPPFRATSGDACGSNTDPTLYQNAIAGTRSTQNGAMFEANKIRNYGFNGGKDVAIFAIAIGQDTSSTEPQGSLDANSRCLLARIANDPIAISNCSNVFTTSVDGDTHADLTENWPLCMVGPPCIDSSQQPGKVFTVDVNGNVTDQLKAIFKEVALLLKLRLTV